MQSFQELFEEQEEQMLDRFIDAEGSHELIYFYEKMKRQAHREKDKEIEAYITGKLLYAYIEYGSYLKSKKVNDVNLARTYLIKALQYDKQNALARYRLGFIAYQRQAYAEALQHFQIAIQGELSQKQMLYAHKYLINSALYVAEHTQKLYEKLNDVEVEELAYPTSPFYSIITDNEQFLLEQAFCILTKDGITYCSKEEAVEMPIDMSFNQLVLSFQDQQASCWYLGKEKPFECEALRLFVHLLMNFSEQCPMTRHDCHDFFKSLGTNQEVKDATFRRRISRLRESLRKIDGLGDVILNKPGAGYYCTVPFMIICRSDSSVAAPYI